MSQTTITPFLVVNNGQKAIDFYISAFGATVTERFNMPDGRLTATISIDGATFYVGDEEPEYNNLSPTKIGGSAVRIILTVNDPDTVFANALNAGATQICPVTTEESWKIGKLSDPFGHIWEIGHPIAQK
jgi:PhnB protein